ncbi:MAG: hypothetical protein R3B96_21285 [Pirellulaceae bacterium]
MSRQPVDVRCVDDIAVPTTEVSDSHVVDVDDQDVGTLVGWLLGGWRLIGWRLLPLRRGKRWRSRR